MLDTCHPSSPHARRLTGPAGGTRQSWRASARSAERPASWQLVRGAAQSACAEPACLSSSRWRACRAPASGRRAAEEALGGHVPGSPTNGRTLVRSWRTAGPLLPGSRKCGMRLAQPVVEVYVGLPFGCGMRLGPPFGCGMRLGPPFGCGMRLACPLDVACGWPANWVWAATSANMHGRSPYTPASAIGSV
eukprot:364164-Chlamydomonas_euryale.AAC.6